jgi:peptidoglycan/xylan/chitin deacetylase (PgdA/CDA1 family)
MGTIQALNWAKSVVRRGAAKLYVRGPRFLHGLQGKVAILTYHRVLSREDAAACCVQPGMYVTPDTFETHVKFLRRHFQILSLPDLLNMWSDKSWDSQSRYCVVTFDDGWLDNYLYALPILSRHGVPATVFLPTGFIGTARWFWPDVLAWLVRRYADSALKVKRHTVSMVRSRHPWCVWVGELSTAEESDALIERCKGESLDQINDLIVSVAGALEVNLPADRQVIDWNEARHMAKAGVTFGSHSVTHRIMTNLPHEVVYAEAKESLEVLRRQGLNPVPVFCYPNGNWSPEVAEWVKAAGYEAATTTRFGYESSAPGNSFGVKRVNVHQDMTCSEEVFAFHLAGFNNLKAVSAR